MDCNREEAVRAKQLAEKKMEIKDFSGALKIAVKAQQLYPQLENISQLILVCEVHCSAEKKSYGTDKDWYGILKIEQTADEISIKKQYRKLALVLHPDKNSFSGSTDAFKLIGEAQRVLLDRDKRFAHDSRRKAFGNISSPGWKPKQQSRPSHVQQQHNMRTQGPSVNYTGVQFTQQRAPTGGQLSAFWTVCPFCTVRYQYYRDVLNTAIICQSCSKPFTAFELNSSSAPATKKPQTPKPAKPVKPAQGVKRNVTTKPVFERTEPPKPQGNLNRKRKKRKEESEESCDSSESSDSDEEVDVRKVPKNFGKVPDDNSDFQYFGDEPRRSSRSKRDVSYKENVNDIDHADVDDASPSKPAENGVKKHVPPKEKEQVVENGKQESGESENDGDTEEEEIEQKVFECPDPEFSDFEKHRQEGSFKAGQIWACYDTEDAMPRFYALIKKVSPGFKLQIIWLKADPVTGDEKKWVKEELPVSCGRYKHEKNDKTEDLLSFSHLVTWEAGPKAKTVIITPRKFETWAVFKNWSMSWRAPEDDEERKYEYEFVEVLSDYDEKAGTRVSYLEKVKGFVCLFERKRDGEMVISSSEKYRFAHMVPSRRMNGEERDGVPEDSLELDPAALPASAFE